MAGPTEEYAREPGAGGNGEQGESGESADAARARRERALSALARANDPSAADTGGGAGSLIQPDKSGKRRGRVLQIALVGVLLVAVVTALAIHFAPRGGTPSAARRPAPPLQLADAQAHMACPRDAAWSADGTRIAVLGYAQRCPFYAPAPAINVSGALVAVYDTATGRLVGEFHPDDLMRKAVTLPPSVQAFLAASNLGGELDIQVRHIRWLPDGKRLAVTGYFFLPSGPPTQNDAGFSPWPGALTDTVLVADASGGQAQVATTPAHPLATPIPITEPGNQTMDAAVEWDLATLTPIALPPALAPSTPQDTLAPALAYQWGPGGALSIRTPLGNAPAPATEPIDAPDGAWFSAWQPALADEGVVFVGKSPLYRWWSEFAALAPDGRYLLDGGVIEWVVRPTGQPADPDLITFTHTAHAPLLPLRDAAMRTLFDDLTEDGAANHGSASVLTAWRPDGKVLVAVAAVGDPRNPRDAIRFYESAGGKLLTTLNVPARSLADVQDVGPRTMRWSPDGSRLFLLDPGLQLATIWGPDTLPK